MTCHTLTSQQTLPLTAMTGEITVPLLKWKTKYVIASNLLSYIWLLPINWIKGILTLQFWIRILNNTEWKSTMLRFTMCAWKFTKNTLWFQLLREIKNLIMPIANCAYCDRGTHGLTICLAQSNCQSYTVGKISSIEDASKIPVIMNKSW